ncbi:MAG: YfhO family protein, partial [Lachnospiraceae bacterium]|nr:YfhO family protein [Lachnospiraceae bacterium]
CFFCSLSDPLYLKPKGLALILVLLTVADLFADAVITFDNFNLSEYEEYSIPVRRTKAMTELVKERDPGLYRMEKYFRRSNNDAFMHDYAGLSHYSSSEKMSTIRFMGRLGFRDNGNWAFYGQGNTALADSLLGVKYILSQFDSTGKPYESITETEEGYFVYENPYALPLLFASAFGDDIGDCESIRDPFLLQEMMADGITGTKNKIFSAIPYVKTHEDDKRTVYEITVEKDGIAEVYFDAPHEQKVMLYYNGEEFGEYFSNFRWNVLDLGRQEKGTKIELALQSENDESLIVDGAYFYTEDHDRLKAFYEDAVSEKCEIKKLSSSHYTGTVHLDESRGAVFCVPFDENWRVTADGKEAQITKTAGNLLGVRLPAGDHSLEFKYISPGQKTGNLVSGITALLLALYIVITRRKKADHF